jgi:hypothetical protein
MTGLTTIRGQLLAVNELKPRAMLLSHAGRTNQVQKTRCGLHANRMQLTRKGNAPNPTQPKKQRLLLSHSPCLIGFLKSHGLVTWKCASAKESL